MTRPATRLEPAKTERPKYPEKSLPTTTAEQMGETLAELPFTGDQVVCLGGDHLWCVLLYPVGYTRQLLHCQISHVAVSAV